MRVCIVGGGGYLGQHVAKHLQADDHHTVLLDISYVDVTPFITLEKTKTTEFKGSMMDEGIREKALYGCDVCFHFAAYGMSGTQSVNKKMIFKINVDGTRLLMHSCRKLGVRRFIFASSVGVIFTDKKLVMVNEDEPYPPESAYYSAYCASKAKAEKEVLRANCSYFRTVALRLRGIYGPGEPRTTNRAAEIISRGFHIAIFQRDGPALTQYSGIHNCSQAMVLAEKELRKVKPRCAGKVYNIVDEGTVESFEFWYPLIKGLGKTTPFIRIPYIAIYYLAFFFEILALQFRIYPLLNRLEVNLMSITNTYSIENAKRDFGYKPTRNHDITEMVQYYQQHFDTNPRSMIDFFSIFKITLACILFTLVIISSSG